MRWGEPVIATSITEITPGGPRYRDHLAVDLARAGHGMETVAEYLWNGELRDGPVRWPAAPVARDAGRAIAAAAGLHREAHVLQLMTVAVSALGIAEGPRRERVKQGRTPLDAARQLILVMAGTLGVLGPRRAYVPVRGDASIAANLVETLTGRPSEERRRALDAALVIAADHELNPATFAARVASSGSADVHSCVSAALSTHYGTLVGRACDRLEAIFPVGASPTEMVAKMRAMMQEGRMPAGFNHHLYPSGDPRARHLLEVALLCGGERPVVRSMLVALRAMEDEFGARPAVECGLVALTRALALPNRTASGLYALGRTAGWVAHVLEQRLAGFVIRPRAKFVRGAALIRPLVE